MLKSQFLDLILNVWFVGMRFVIPYCQQLNLPEAAQAKIRQLQKELGQSTGVASGAAAGATTASQMWLLYEKKGY